MRRIEAQILQTGSSHRVAAFRPMRKMLIEIPTVTVGHHSHPVRLVMSHHGLPPSHFEAKTVADRIDTPVQMKFHLFNLIDV